MAIKRQSETVNGNQEAIKRQSETVNGNQAEWPLGEAASIAGTQLQSVAIKPTGAHQWQSVVLDGNQ